MKKIFFLLFILLMANGQWSMVNGQTFAITTDNVTLLATPDEVGEMMFSGGNLSIGDTVIDVTTISSMTYSAANFDPLLVDVQYSAQGGNVTMPLSLADSIWVERDGAYVTITSAKKGGAEVVYTLSGTTADGGFNQVGEYKCKVRLNGVNITSQRGAAVHIKNGKRIDIDVANGTVNTFVDHADTLHDACFHVKGHPEFFGMGTINITGKGRHAYKSGEYTELKDSLGTINILAAPADGMHVGQYFKMKGGTVNVRNGVKGDGIQVECNSDSTKEYNGQLFLRNGSVNIEISGDSCEGLKCDSLLTISGGTHNVACGGLFSKCLKAGTHMVMYEKKSTPVVTLTNTGGYVTYMEGKTEKHKKSVCLKVEQDFFFHKGTLKLTADEDIKGKSANIGGDYVFVSKAISLTASPAIDVDGAIRTMSDESKIIAREQGKGIYISMLED